MKDPQALRTIIDLRGLSEGDEVLVRYEGGEKIVKTSVTSVDAFIAHGWGTNGRWFGWRPKRK